ncbi:enoyl-CoA hydratase-related protein [Streptomyces antibioticus]|uniref:enoyl-CoA hydratase/isomerase family protein n=2 Tax=Streptomyces antibioticus TaxID=1890 RepID=UPI00225BA24C|nr:enoyl-CoA hydratase-related protein [Streptomyces antibioticus]MCX5169767.1 enoyl-CoA hydratase-related protein [Streptomyces antibioticus]
MTPPGAGILVTVDGHVTRLTLDRPEALNALTPALRDELIGLLAAASADPDIRAVILTGTGRGFCAGADLRGGAGAGERGAGRRLAEERGAGERLAEERVGGERRAGEPVAEERGARERVAGERVAEQRVGGERRAGEPVAEQRGAGERVAEQRPAAQRGAGKPVTEQHPAPEHGAGEPVTEQRLAGDVARTLRMGAQRLISAVLDCEKPVIAAVNGTAAGLGVHLALACDLVLAAESARFIEVFVRRGLVPDGGGAYLLPRLIGPQRAKELMFFGDALTAADAERLGLVNRVVPDADLPKTAHDWAARLAAGPTRALALTKQLVNASLDTDRATAFAAEAAAQEINMTTADAREGVASFVERRGARFRGR